MSSTIAQAQPAAPLSAAVATAQIFPLATNALVPAFLGVPGSGRLEQKLFEVRASGMATTAGAFTGAPSLYGALALPTNPLVPGNWTLLGAGAATAFATTSGAWLLQAQFLFDSVSGKLQGSFTSNVNNAGVASAGPPTPPTSPSWPISPYSARFGRAPEGAWIKTPAIAPHQRRTHAMAKEKEKVMKHLGGDKAAKEKGKDGERKLHTHSVTVTRADHGGHHIRHQMRDDEGAEAGEQTAIAPDNEAMGQQVQAAMADQPPAGQGQPMAPPPAIDPNAPPTAGQ